ncbi:MAG TPA: nicotinate-nucleotide adenylyltransferase [Bacteroidetes bacterium]|nr:nicotinate-nucleotide adenylyltransferase [Bacteroidota bacterium]
MNIGLYFGSFNPVHTGHLIIANHIINFTETDEVWFVISPQNPFKKRQNLINSYDRLALVELAIGDYDKLKPCTIEFNMPVPSYTIDTLTYLKEKYPDYNFKLIMGSDNLVNFHHWKNYDVILKYYSILVYMRPGFEDVPYLNHKKITALKAPLLEISSSFIRKLIKEGKSVRYLVPDAVYEEIVLSNLYKE